MPINSPPIFGSLSLSETLEKKTDPAADGRVRARPDNVRRPAALSARATWHPSEPPPPEARKPAAGPPRPEAASPPAPFARRRRPPLRRRAAAARPAGRRRHLVAGPPQPPSPPRAAAELAGVARPVAGPGFRHRGPGAAAPATERRPRRPPSSSSPESPREARPDPVARVIRNPRSRSG